MAIVGHMNVYEALQNLGLKDKERDAYLALLELGEGTVAHVAGKANLKRPTTYLIMSALGERGLVSEFKRGKHTYFVPRNPEGLLEEARSRVGELEEVLPQLNLMFVRGKGKPRVIVTEGKERLDRAYDDWFITKGEALFMGNIDLSLEAYPRTFQKLKYRDTSSGFSIRELIVDTQKGREYAAKESGKYRSIRFLPSTFALFEADTAVFGDRILINSIKQDYFSVSIESKPMADSFRILFDALWGISKE